MADTEGQPPAPTRGVPVPVLEQLNGHDRRLRYTFRTRRELIAEMGGEEQLKEKLTAGIGGEAVIKVLWYGLKHEDPELTVDQLEDMVDMENLVEIVQAMARALGFKTKPTVEISGANPPVAAASSASVE